MVNTKTKLIVYSSAIEPVKQINFINSFLEHYEKNAICIWRDLSNLDLKQIISYLISVEAIGIIFPTPQPLKEIKSMITPERLIIDKLTKRIEFYDTLFLEGDQVVIYNSFIPALKKFIDINLKQEDIYYDMDISEYNEIFEFISLFNEKIKEMNPEIHLKDDDVLFKTSTNKPYSKNDIVIDDLNNQGKLGYYILFYQLTNYYPDIDFSNFLNDIEQKKINEDFCITNEINLNNETSEI